MGLEKSVGKPIGKTRPAYIYKRGLGKTGKGAPLGQEGLLIEKHGSGKIGGQTDWANQACLYIHKGSGKKQERGHPWDKKACLFKDMGLEKPVGKPIGKTRPAYIYKRGPGKTGNVHLQKIRMKNF